ncbi:hypothetical protein RIF29_31509 [Crotalaria pallida]|uniref:Uncharacterized protein n=1 Tax=Crotalaria pallida TaxID=3830 RepID=A0AAN9EMI9_CROPI
MRATPEAASADAAVQTARLASKAPSKEKRQICKVLPIGPTIEVRPVQGIRTCVQDTISSLKEEKQEVSQDAIYYYRCLML